ncbi:MAG: acyl-CoA dehydrogenase family protein [Croceivirga sp.]|mgnify:CR=1 FL=1
MVATDYYQLYRKLTDEQRLIQQSTAQWVQSFIKPKIDSCFKEGEVLEDVVEKLAEIGAFGLIIPEKYGGMGADYISYGLMMQELERGDTSVRVLSSIQTSLVMYAIYRFGSEKQKDYYLPKLASGEFLGAFGLTEPNYGSNAAAMHSYFNVENEKVVLNGTKLWIGNAEKCDVAIVWAKSESGAVKGILVDASKTTNFTTSTIHDKWSFRASSTGELIFSDAELPKDLLLEGCTSIKDAYECLNIGRYAVAWGSIGIAQECYETALQYSQERIQFDKPIGSNQLVQKKLAEMITEITKAQLLCHELGDLMNEGMANYQQISMAKRNNVHMAQTVAKEARQILGGMGITGDYPIMRHMMNIETLITYQGTHEMHLLITGRDVTGFNAI